MKYKYQIVDGPMYPTIAKVKITEPGDDNYQEYKQELQDQEEEDSIEANIRFNDSMGEHEILFSHDFEEFSMFDEVDEDELYDSIEQAINEHYDNTYFKDFIQDIFTEGLENMVGSWLE